MNIINNKDWCKAERYTVDNLITLCQSCHILFHQKYGNKYNTKEQFRTFMQDFI